MESNRGIKDLLDQHHSVPDYKEQSSTVCGPEKYHMSADEKRLTDFTGIWLMLGKNSGLNFYRKQIYMKFLWHLMWLKATRWTPKVQKFKTFSVEKTQDCFNFWVWKTSCICILCWWYTTANFSSLKETHRASLVAQWLRTCLPMQGTRVRALVWEDPTCHGATKPMHHNYWACASGACAPQQERPR